MTSALSFAMILIQYLPAAIQGISEAAQLIEWGVERVKTMVAEKRDPSPAEWDELNAKTDALRARLHSDAT